MQFFRNPKRTINQFLYKNIIKILNSWNYRNIMLLVKYLEILYL